MVSELHQEMLSAPPHEYWLARERYLNAVGELSVQRSHIDPFRFSGEYQRNAVDALQKF